MAFEVGGSGSNLDNILIELLNRQGGGGEGGASSWEQLSNRPEWLDDYTNVVPNVSLFPNDANYLTKSSLKASIVPFDNTDTFLSATNVQGAISEVFNSLMQTDFAVEQTNKSISQLANYVNDTFLLKSVFEDMFEFDYYNGKKVIKAKYDFYSVGDVAAFQFSENEPPHGVEYFRDLLDVIDAGNPSANQVWGWDGSKYAWLSVKGGASSWDEISDRPTWLDQYKTRKPTVGSWDNDRHYATESWVENKHYLTEQSLTGYATQNWVNAQGFLTEHQSLAGYATQDWVGNNYLSINGKAQSAYVSDSIAYTGTANDVLSAHQTSSSYFNSEEGSASYLIFNHIDGATYYHQMIRMPFWSIPQYQRMSNGNLSGWKDFITEENISWQSVGSALKLTNARYIWGQPFNGTGNIAGDMSAVGSIYLDTTGEKFIGRQGNYGGGVGLLFKDDGYRGDYIGIYDWNAVGDVFCYYHGKGDYKPTMLFGVDSVFNKTLRIGDAVLEYDATNKALFVKDANEQTMNLVATGDVAGFSALGSFDSLTDLSLTDWLKVGDWKLTPNGLTIGNDTIIDYDNEDSFIVIGRGIDVEINGDIQAGKHDMYIRSIESQSITTGAIEANTLYVSNGTSGTHNITDIHADNNYVYITFKNGSTSRTMKLQPVSIS